MDRAVTRGGLSRRTWMALAAVLLLLVGLALAWPTYRRFASVDRTVDASRLQVAPVVLGDLVRDASADGRIVSANAPTLFASTAGFVTLQVKAGDPVRRGQVLATIDSPELRSRLEQEQTALQSVDVALGRARIAARQSDARNASATELGEVRLQSAKRNLERARQTFEEGLLNKVDYERAQDDVQLAEVELKTVRAARGLERETGGVRDPDPATRPGASGLAGRGSGATGHAVGAGGAVRRADRRDQRPGPRRGRRQPARADRGESRRVRDRIQPARERGGRSRPWHAGARALRGPRVRRRRHGHLAVGGRQPGDWTRRVRGRRAPDAAPEPARVAPPPVRDPSAGADAAAWGLPAERRRTDGVRGDRRRGHAHADRHRRPEPVTRGDHRRPARRRPGHRVRHQRVHRRASRVLLRNR